MVLLEEILTLLEHICKIPAPSHHEEKRAEFCKDWLEAVGAEGVYVDEALNVVYPMGCEGRDDVVVFMAHTDTVFPDMTEPMPFRKEGDRIYSPGVGDDTVCLAMMLTVIKEIVQSGHKPKYGVLFVANSCEEGLGNLKGVRKIMEDYGDRIRRVYTFDGCYDALVCKCVGSHRYKVTMETEGGHSFNAFGKKNAIVAAAELICRLNQCSISQKEGSKTTFNVGVMEGGTSVNTIAQHATFLYEYRSDDYDCLQMMKAFFEREVALARQDREVTVSVETLGIRPCGNLPDKTELETMINRVRTICEKHTGLACRLTSGSTDANMPMSMGIPAICVGTYLGGGMHTREEYMEISSIPVGLNITRDVILEYFE